MARPIRTRLFKTPQLHAIYLSVSNQRRLTARRCLIGAIVFGILWISAVAVFLNLYSAAAAVGFSWLNSQSVLIFGACVFIGSVLVSRRRALMAAEFTRSWTTVLPVAKASSILQAVAIAGLPIAAAFALFAAAFGTLCVLAYFRDSVPAPLRAWSAASTGLVIGVALGYLRGRGPPSPPLEGSRYVPHRPRIAASTPTGSLSALSQWPVRRMFASARPKLVMRAMIPVLVLIPIGSDPAATMLTIGLFVMSGALILLVSGVVHVSVEALRWLTPLPVHPGMIAKKGFPLVLLLLVAGSFVIGWMLYVLGFSLVSSAIISSAMLGAALLIALSGIVIRLICRPS